MAGINKPKPEMSQPTTSDSIQDLALKPKAKIVSGYRIKTLDSLRELSEKADSFLDENPEKRINFKTIATNIHLGLFNKTKPDLESMIMETDKEFAVYIKKLKNNITERFASATFKLDDEISDEAGLVLRVLLSKKYFYEEIGWDLFLIQSEIQKELGSQMGLVILPEFE